MSQTVTAGTVYLLDFQYHMYGVTMGTATLEAYTGTSWVSAWTQTGNLGNAWQQASVTVAGGATMLRFQYTAGSSYTGDFALDDIQSTGGDDTHSYSYSYDGRNGQAQGPGEPVSFVMCAARAYCARERGARAARRACGFCVHCLNKLCENDARCCVYGALTYF